MDTSPFNKKALLFFLYSKKECRQSRDYLLQQAHEARQRCISNSCPSRDSRSSRFTSPPAACDLFQQGQCLQRVSDLAREIERDYDKCIIDMEMERNLAYNGLGL